MQVLYTGFKGNANSSCRLLDFFEGDKLLLTNSFDGLKRDIEGVTKEYGAAFMFGLDKSLKTSARIEVCAQRDGKRLQTALDFSFASDAFKAEGINCLVSANPTNYFCNDAYFYMLERLCGKALFFHIPPVRYMTEDMYKAAVRACGRIKENLVCGILL